MDEEGITTFLRRAKRGRGFPLPIDATSFELLSHLNLLDEDKPTHAAMLLFGKQPQRFVMSSEVKCAHFHGTEVAKPIPSYQVYKGTLFSLVDQAIDFVMSKINLWVGTREGGAEVPVAYEIPQEVVAEAIVNAVAHRDYDSNGSVQVMLFADRLEIWNPGGLPPSLTLEKLRHPHGSVPRNPLLAEPLYLTKYIECMGTSTGDMIRRCREVGLPEPEFSISDGFKTTILRKSSSMTGQVDPWVERVLRACELKGELKSIELQEVAGIRHRETFQRNYLDQLLRDELIERTIPDKPKSRLQKYRLSQKGKILLEDLSKNKK
ncbi:TPA: Fic family protein [Legionella pneumophila]